MERLRGDLPPNVCAAGSSCAYASTSTRRATRPSARVISLPSRSGATSPGMRAKNACGNGDLFESGIAQHLHQALVHAIVVFEGKDPARPFLERGMEGVHVVPELGDVLLQLRKEVIDGLRHGFAPLLQARTMQAGAQTRREDGACMARRRTTPGLQPAGLRPAGRRLERDVD